MRGRPKAAGRGRPALPWGDCHGFGSKGRVDRLWSTDRRAVRKTVRAFLLNHCARRLNARLAGDGQPYHRKTVTASDRKVGSTVPGRPTVDQFGSGSVVSSGLACDTSSIFSLVARACRFEGLSWVVEAATHALKNKVSIRRGRFRLRKGRNGGTLNHRRRSRANVLADWTAEPPMVVAISVDDEDRTSACRVRRGSRIFRSLVASSRLPTPYANRLPAERASRHR